MSTEAASATRIQRVFRRYRDQKIVQANATRNAAAIKIQAVFRGVLERKLVRAAKRLAAELSAKEPMQRALRTHLFRRRLRKAAQDKIHKRVTLEGLRSHPTTKQLSEATAFKHHGKRFPTTFKKVYSLQTTEGTSKVHKLFSGPTAHTSFLQVVLAKIRQYVMRSGTRTHALLATTSRPVALYVIHLTKVYVVNVVLPLLRGRCCATIVTKQRFGRFLSCQWLVTLAFARIKNGRLTWQVLLPLYQVQ
jgi:hypothetical protein